MRGAAFKYLNGITLLGMGGVLLAFSLGGRIDAYLHPQFRPGVLVGGILLVLAGTVYCLTKGSRRCCVDGECVHESNATLGRSLAAFGVLVVPLVTGSVFSKDVYDRTAVLNRSVVPDGTALAARATTERRLVPGAPAATPAPSGADAGQGAAGAVPPAGGQAADPQAAGAGDVSEAEQYLPKGADGNVALEVTDLLYGETEASLRKMFTDRTVEVVGQYLPSKTANRFKLVRMLIVCCAADARPMMVSVETNLPASQPDMAWVKVTGKPTYTEVEGRTRVMLKADKVTSVDPPADAMLY